MYIIDLVLIFVQSEYIRESQLSMVLFKCLIR